MARALRHRHYIREWRKFRGLTQERLSERIGVDRTYVSKIENGHKRYDQPFIEAAADALQCQPADLIMRNPTDPAGIWSIWDQIPGQDREKAVRILEALIPKSRTN